MPDSTPQNDLSLDLKNTNISISPDPVVAQIREAQRQSRSRLLSPYQKATPVVLGGMGPEAQNYYIGNIFPQEYQRIYKQVHADGKYCDQHFPCLYSFGFPFSDRTQALLASSSDSNNSKIQLLGDLKEALERLSKNVSTASSSLVVTCNTAHYFLRVLQGKISLNPQEPSLRLKNSLLPPQVVFLDMVDLTCSSCQNLLARRKQTQTHKVAIFATDGTNKTNLYFNELQKKGLTPYVLETETDDRKLQNLDLRRSPQGKVMRAIYGKDGVKTNNNLESRKKAAVLFRNSVDIALEDGCSVGILGCTELPLLVEFALDRENPSFKKSSDGTYLYSKHEQQMILIDPMRVAARAQLIHTFKLFPLQNVSDRAFATTESVMTQLRPAI